VVEIVKLRVLEGFGYVAAVMIVAGKLSPRLEVMHYFGLAFAVVVLTRLGARHRGGSGTSRSGSDYFEESDEE